MIVPDYDIRKLRILEPFIESCPTGISSGLTSAGYDLRLAPELLVLKPSFGGIMDPKLCKDPEYRKQVFDEVSCEKEFVLHAHGYVLGRSIEYIRMPRWLKGHCLGKSTYARCGVLINTTPLEPEWEGFLTVEIANVSPLPVRLYISEGIAQLELHLLTNFPEISYKDKQGKYQEQKGVQPPIVR